MQILNDNFQLWAYIDPGTGSLILQLVIGALITGGIFFRRIFFWPIECFKQLRARNQSELGEAEQGELLKSK